MRKTPLKRKSKLRKVSKLRVNPIDEYIKLNLPYYGAIQRKYRYTDPIKDKAWSLLSDYVRCRDFVKYGTCVATGEHVSNWRETDAGHFYTMAGNTGLLGFSDMNVHMQKKISNKLSSAADGANFEREIIKRYGTEIMGKLQELKRSTVKADSLYFLGVIKETWGKFLFLKTLYPDCTYPEYLTSPLPN
jgi:hypothetical protein